MAKKKTNTKELKPKKVKKQDLIIPDTPKVTIILNKDGKEYTVGHELACELIKLNRAKLG